MTRKSFSTVFMLAVAVALSACSRKPEPPAPTPEAPPQQPTATRPDTAGQGARAAAEAAERERAAREAEAAEVRAALAEMVFFDYDQSSIRSDQQDVLNRKVPLLRANPAIRLRVEGHADERGSVEYNLALSVRRANAIRDYLSGFGIDANRFDIVAMGEERPLEAGASEDAYARNRRGEFHITAGGDNLTKAR